VSDCSYEVLYDKQSVAPSLARSAIAARSTGRSSTTTTTTAAAAAATAVCAS
jgi:hypothetical protein